MEIIVVSIGALAKNPFWNERAPVRPSHATTTMLRGEKRQVLVDPSLPAQALAPRLFERTGLQPDAITDIFLTSWRPVHRRALPLFSHARWWLAEPEIDFAQQRLEEALEQAQQADDADTVNTVQQERTLLARCTPAPDSIAEGVDLFPLHGYTPGHCGLLISANVSTTVIAGDAVPTAAHFLAGRVFEDSYSLEAAKESMAEMYEVADVIIPGHDNLFFNPRTTGM